MTPMLLIDAALRGALVALALLVMLQWLRERVDAPAARTGVLLMGGLVVQAFASSPWFEAQPPAGWWAPLVGISVGNAVLFWLFARSLFDDDFEPRRRHAVIWAAVMALGVLFYAVVVIPMRRELSPAAMAVAVAMRWAPIVFGLLAMAAALRQWRVDLVERRRRLRAFVLGAGVVYTLVTALARLISQDGRLPPPLAGADIAMLLAIVATVAVGVLRPTGAQALMPMRRAAPTLDRRAGRPDPVVAAGPPELPAADPAEDRLAARLRQLMAEERRYRREDLTIAGLATELGVPEYRLRRLINQRLGHRNFNAFVNGYRLEDARGALADPAQREVPVLTIGLDAGFGSIGPFNRSFKAATGLTPTEFRRQALADS